MLLIFSFIQCLLPKFCNRFPLNCQYVAFTPTCNFLIWIYQYKWSHMGLLTAECNTYSHPNCISSSLGAHWNFAVGNRVYMIHLVWNNHEGSFTWSPGQQCSFQSSLDFWLLLSWNDSFNSRIVASTCEWCLRAARLYFSYC